MKNNLAKKALNFIMSEPTGLAIVPVRLEVNGNREARIEGIRRILNYDENNIKVSVKNMNISILGRRLTIKYLNLDSLSIIGVINSIEFHS